MPLEEREEALYRRDAIRREQSAAPSRIPVRTQKPGARWGTVEAAPQTPTLRTKTAKGARHILRGIVWSALVLALLGGGAYGFLKWWSRPSVTVMLQGPTEVRAGERVSYEIVIENSARSALENTSLTLRAGRGVLFPETSERIVRKELAEAFPPATSRRETVSMFFLGKEGDERDVEISFRYRMPNIASEFVRTETIKVKIAAPAVALTLNLPKQTLSSANFAFSYEWKNISALPIKYLTAEFVYPDDFTFVEATPAPEEGRRWQFQELLPNATSSVAVVGRIGAEAGQTRTFRATLATRVRNDQIVLGEVTGEIAVIENPLVIAMSVNGQTSYNADPGELLDYRITFKNNFSETLRDIVIAAKLSGRMFDVRSIETDGAFDSRDMTVTFNGGNSPQLLFLDPQESGSVSFRIKVADAIPPGLRNPVLSASAEMTSATEPRYLGIEGPVRATASVDTKVNGIISLTSRTYLRDATLGFATVGPWPMRANHTTQMTVHWIVTASGNDFSNIVVSTVLPGGVAYLGNARGNISGTQITANPRTSRVEWQIPNLAAFQTKEFIFQIGITPSAADVGNPVNVLNAVSLVATDGFTGNRPAVETAVTRSDALADPSISRPETEGRVTE